MATDFTKAPLEILVDLINFANGSALTLADISFSPATALLVGNRNTGITIKARPSSVYSGSRDLTYNRVDMATIPGQRSKQFNIEGAQSIKDLIPQINAAYRLNLLPEDYFDDPLPVIDPTATVPYNFALRAKPGSYIYRGLLTLTSLGDTILIAEFLTQNILNGFYLPVDPEKALSGEEVLNGFYYDPQIVVTSDEPAPLTFDMAMASS
jgi:hypothetical protein